MFLKKIEVLKIYEKNNCNLDINFSMYKIGHSPQK